MSNANVPAVPIPGFNTGREAQYAKRIKELEEELRLMKVESDKNVNWSFFARSFAYRVLVETDDC